MGSSAPGQWKNAATNIAAGLKLGFPERGQAIVRMTAIGGSMLRMVDHGDAQAGAVEARSSRGPDGEVVPTGWTRPRDAELSTQR